MSKARYLCLQNSFVENKHHFLSFFVSHALLERSVRHCYAWRWWLHCKISLFSLCLSDNKQAKHLSLFCLSGTRNTGKSIGLASQDFQQRMEVKECENYIRSANNQQSWCYYLMKDISDKTFSEKCDRSELSEQSEK